eukprot:793706-Pelagomonas_calceolata.AAC.2
MNLDDVHAWHPKVGTPLLPMPSRAQQQHAPPISTLVHTFHDRAAALAMQRPPPATQTQAADQAR